MKRIMNEKNGYTSPECALLWVEQEGMLCTSQGVTEVDGNHEGFGKGISFSWEIEN